MTEQLSDKTARCLNCGSTNYEIWSTAQDIEYFTLPDKKFKYLLCKDCDCLFLEEPPQERLDEIYPENYYSYQHQTKSILTRAKDYLDKRTFSKLTTRLSGESLSALDIGGGSGTVLSLLRECDERFEHTTVIDIDDKAATRARESGHEYLLGTIETQQIERSFDLILVLNLIEHVYAPGELLKRCRSLLSEQGIILIKTPNWDSLDQRLFRHKSWAGYHCPRHWCLWTRESFEKLAANCGLSSRASWYTQGAPFWAASILGQPWFPKSYNQPLVYHPFFGPLAGLFAIFDTIRGFVSPLSQMYFLLESAKPDS